VLQAILLAAGLSKRFGISNKLLHQVDGKTIFLQTLENLYQANLGQIVIVTGLDRDELVDQIPSHISYQEVFNPDYRNGMTSSIQAAVEGSPDNSCGYMICLSDQIKIKPLTYKNIFYTYKKLYLKNEKTILIPSFQNQKANPVVLSARYKSDILKLNFSNGCKPIVRKNMQHTHVLEMDDPGLTYDIDTLDDLD